MNTGKTLFAQLMDFLPWTTFTRIVDRYGGDHRVRTLSCAEQYRSMAFAQLTYRESLRDIETCLSVPRIETLSHGLPPAGPALDAGRCQRKARLAYPCGVGPAAHHPGEDAVRRRRTGVGPDQYRLPPWTRRPSLCACRSFPWVHFRTTKAAVKMHTLLDLRGNIPSFIHISDGKLHDVHALDMLLPEAGAIYVVGSWLRRLCPPLCVAPSRGLLRHACQVEHRCSSRLFGADGSLDRHHLRPDHLPGRLLHPSGLPRTSAAHPLQGPRVRQDAGLHHQQLLASGRHHLRALQKPLAGGTLLQVDQAASSDQAVLRHVGERGEDADLDCRPRSTSSSPSSRSASTWTPRSTLCYRSSR